MSHSIPSHPGILPAPNTIDIWQIPLNPPAQDISSLYQILDQDEQRRYQRLHSRFQQRYLLSHVACRNILADYIQTPPKEISFKKNQHGKPALNSTSELVFNLSHSYDMAILAVSQQGDIGADLEYMKKKHAWEKIAQRFFNTAEITYLFDLEQADQQSAFFQIWTRKEAFIKALGTGLATSLSSFSVAKNDTVDVLKSSEENQTWYQKDLKLEPAYKASVVKNTPIEKIRYYSYP